MVDRVARSRDQPDPCEVEDVGAVMWHYMIGILSSSR